MSGPNQESRVWSNGWKEQCGRIVHDNTQNWKSHTFLIPFAYNNYAITISGTELKNMEAGLCDAIVNLSRSDNTHFDWYWNADSNYGISFYACGY